MLVDFNLPLAFHSGVIESKIKAFNASEQATVYVWFQVTLFVALPFAMISLIPFQSIPEELLAENMEVKIGKQKQR